MALIDMGTADGSTLGNPSAGNYYFFNDSNNGNKYTRRDSAGNDILFEGSDNDLSQLGWVWIRDDTYDSGSPLALSASSRTIYDFSIDFDIDDHAPTGVETADWFDEATSKLNLSNEGEAYILRMKMTANPTLNNRNFIIDIDTNGSVIWEKTVQLARGATTDSIITEEAWLFAEAGLITNGMSIYLTCDGDCDVFDFNLGLSRINVAK